MMRVQNVPGLRARDTPAKPWQQRAGRNRFGSIRFGSGLFERNNRFGWFRKNKFRFDAVRPAFFGGVVAWSGSVRFGSASGSGRFQSETVRFGRFGSVSYSVLKEKALKGTLV